MRQRAEEPKKRSDLRLKLGGLWYSACRRFLWLFWRRRFARTQTSLPLSHRYFAHQTLLMRKLKDVDMWMQKNKVINLRLACEQLNGITVKPGEVFSYWYLIGKPTRKRGFTDGMVLKSGTFTSGLGGGLC